MGTRTFLTRQAMKTISFYARATHLKKKEKRNPPFFTRFLFSKLIYKEILEN